MWTRVSWQRRVRVGGALAATLLLAACGDGSSSAPAAQGTPSAVSTGLSASRHPYVAPPFRHRIPGMPPVIDNDVYSQDRAGMLAPQVRHDPHLLYVPDSHGSTVTVISQRTHRIVRVIPAGT